MMAMCLSIIIWISSSIILQHYIQIFGGEFFRPTIRHQTDTARIWFLKITAVVYDPRKLACFDKQGLTTGSAIAEKQGTSNVVRANTAMASLIGARGPGESYELVDHK
jgi:hypothetical protein